MSERGTGAPAVGDTRTASPEQRRKRSKPVIDSGYLEQRVDRLRQSSLMTSLYALPFFFSLVTLLLLFANWSPNVSLFVNVFRSLFSSLFVTLVSVGVGYVGLLKLTAMYEHNIGTLSYDGKLIQARLSGPPLICGGRLVTRTLRGLLGALWEPLAPTLGKQIPIHCVYYTFEVSGKKIRAHDLFYADEEIVQDGSGNAWVLVDPKAPYTRAWLVRRDGLLQDSFPDDNL